MSTLSTMETLIFLKKVPLFSSFQLEDLLRLKEITEEIHVTDGEAIIREGEEGRDAYVIVSGSVAVVKTHGAQETVLAQLEHSSCFGEMSIVEDEPRTATVKAIGDCTLLLIKGSEFREMILSNAQLSFSLTKVFSSRNRKLLATK